MNQIQAVTDGLRRFSWIITVRLKNASLFCNSSLVFVSVLVLVGDDPNLKMLHLIERKVGEDNDNMIIMIMIMIMTIMQ